MGVWWDLSFFSWYCVTVQQLLPGRINGIRDRDDKLLLVSIFISRFFTHFSSFPFSTTFIPNLKHTPGMLPLDTRNGRPFRDNGSYRDTKFCVSGSARTYGLFVKERKTEKYNIFLQECSLKTDMCNCSVVRAMMPSVAQTTQRRLVGRFMSGDWKRCIKKQLSVSRHYLGIRPWV